MAANGEEGSLTDLSTGDYSMKPDYIKCRCILDLHSTIPRRWLNLALQSEENMPVPKRDSDLVAFGIVASYGREVSKSRRRNIIRDIAWELNLAPSTLNQDSRSILAL